MQRTRERHVIEIMTSRLCQWPMLTPAGHAAIDQARVDGVTDIGANTHALGHAGTQAFDQDVGSCDNL